jgi:putative membrane protein
MERPDIPERSRLTVDRQRAQPVARGEAHDGRAGASHAVPAACLTAFALVWTLLAVAPRDRAAWLLENLLTFVAVPAVALTYRRFRFSDRAYVQATIFLAIHTFGSHYTYSAVPLGAWVAELFGASRNHYDRVAHFAFGALLLLPLRELAFRRASTIGRFAAAALAFAAIGGAAAAYEVLEWLVAVIVDPSAGIAFLGTQGDVWDAQKDMGLALLGAAMATAVDARLTSGRGATG